MKNIKKKLNIIINKKHIISISIFLMVFLTGAIGFYTYPNSIKREYNLYETTEDGISICFDVYEPKTSLTESNKNAVIVGHGVMVSKEFMRLIALDLSYNGFVVVNFDFRGHGRSGGGLSDDSSDEVGGENPLAKDIRAMKTYLNNRGDINMSNLGFVGYSMGGSAGFNQLFTDNDFRAMVGIAPATILSLTNSTNPQNLLMIVGKYDEAIEMDKLYSIMEKKTGIAKDKIEENVQYGDFSNGTAAKLIIDPIQEHFFAPFDADFIKETRLWLSEALLDDIASPNMTMHRIQLSFFILSVIGALGIVILSIIILFPQHILKTESKNEPILKITHSILPAVKEDPSFFKRYFIFGIGLSIISMGAALPLMFTPLPMGVFTTGLVIGPGLATMLLLRKYYKKEDKPIKYFSLLKEQFTSSEINLLVLGKAIVCSGLLYIVMYFSIGNLLTHGFNKSKAPWGILFWAFSMFGLLNLNLFLNILAHKLNLPQYKLHSKEKIKGIVVMIFLISSIIFVDLIILSLIMGDFFLLMTFWAAAPMYILIILINQSLHPRMENSLIISIILSIVIAVICTNFVPAMM